MPKKPEKKKCFVLISHRLSQQITQHFVKEKTWSELEELSGISFDLHSVAMVGLGWNLWSLSSSCGYIEVLTLRWDSSDWDKVTNDAWQGYSVQINSETNTESY